MVSRVTTIWIGVEGERVSNIYFDYFFAFSLRRTVVVCQIYYVYFDVCDKNVSTYPYNQLLSLLVIEITV